MTTERTRTGQEIEAALEEVLSHVRGEVDLPCRIVDHSAGRCSLAGRVAPHHEPPSGSTT